MSDVGLNQSRSGLEPPTQLDAAASRTGDAPNLQSIVSTAELKRRPSRPPDYAAESRALIALAQQMADSPDGILQKLADTALVVCGAHSAGLSLLEESDQKSSFHWRAIAGQWAPHIHGGTPRNFGPCGTVLDRNVALLCSHPERDFPYFGEVKPLLEEGLLVPFYIKGEAVGTIWVVAHDESRRFDAEDLRVMTSLATFAAAAYQTVLALNATQRIASIVESSDDAIISKDLDGVITTWNRGAERVFGYTAEQVIGKPVSILIPPDRQDEEPAILDRVRRGERIEHYETVRLRKHGSRVDISITVSPIKSAEGKIIGASKIARDITERKRAGEKLRESEERYHTLFAAAPMAVFVCDRNAVIQYYNNQAVDLWGREPVRGVEQHCGSVKLWLPNGTLLPHAQNPIVEVLRTGIAMRNVEVFIERPDGSRLPVLVNFAALTNAEGEITGAVTSFVDITERKRSEAHIAVLAREAEHRTKNVLATVQATVRLSQSDTSEGLKHAIEGRIQALANVHTLFVQSRWSGAELHSLITQELLPYCKDGETRVRIAGPSLLLEPGTAQAIAVTVHELATNAAKYGALSVPEGTVHVEWSSAKEGRLLLRWTESGGPPVKPSTRRGFGTRVMESMIRDQMMGDMRFDWRAEGLACEISLPASNQSIESTP